MKKNIYFFFLLIPATSWSQSLEELCKLRVDSEETPGIAVAIIEDERTRLALIKVIEDEVNMDLTPSFGEIVNLAKKRVA